MPKYIQFEDDAVFPNIGKPLQVSGFYLTNEPSDVPFQEPFAWDPSLVPFLENRVFLILLEQLVVSFSLNLRR